MPLAHLFNRETAKINAVKSAQARERNKQAAIERARMMEETIKAIAGPTPERKPAEDEITRTIRRLEHQMGLIDDLLDKCKEPSDWRDLTNSRAKIFETWRILSGIPMPGSRRPGREPSRRQQVTLSPIEPSPGPAQPPACGPDTPTGSG